MAIRPRPVVFACLVASAALATAPLAPRRAILVSFDGVGGLDLTRRLAEGQLSPDGFARAVREGFSAERLEVVTPSLTAVSHASIASGAYPGRTGIVSNLYHPAGTPLSTRLSGFDAVPAVEAIWEAAARQGKRVASLAWPGLAQGEPRTSTPVALRYVDPERHGTFWSGSLAAGSFHDLNVALPLGVRSFSPPKAFDVAPGGGAAPVPFVLIDSTDDGRRDYDEIVAVAPNGELRTRARAGEWFEMAQRRAEDGGDTDVLVGRWGKLLALAPDLSSVSVYLGLEGRTYAKPADFRRTLDRRAGFWPGPPDYAFLNAAEPDIASFLEQGARFTRYFLRAFEVADRRGDWDLLLAYQPVADESEHAMLLTDPRQPGYTPERAAAYAAALRDVLRELDRAAAQYLRFAERGDVLLVSDHGMRPVWRSFLLREALRRKGWVKVGTNGSTTAPDSPADVIRRGGSGLIYVNRAGTTPGGVVPPDKADALVAEMAAYLRGLKDPSGAPVFSTVVTNGEAAALGLASPNAGDLIAIAAGGTSIRSDLPAAGDAAPLFTDPEGRGEHGFDPDPKLDGIFFHVGGGIRPERVPSFRSVDVAGRLADRLGLAPFGGAGGAGGGQAPPHQSAKP